MLRIEKSVPVESMCTIVRDNTMSAILMTNILKHEQSVELIHVMIDGEHSAPRVDFHIWAMILESKDQAQTISLWAYEHH